MTRRHNLYTTSKESEEKRQKENFPVASFLMSKRIRSGVIAFYNFARHADDIADNSKIEEEIRISILREVDKNISSEKILFDDVPQWAVEYCSLVKNAKLDGRHARALLSAFIQDVEKNRYNSWDDLIDYCMRSAAPVGRAVLELHGEYEANIEASDALCNVLQILNHLQDMKDDYIDRNRVYFPEVWFSEISDIEQVKSTNGIRRITNKVLDKTDKMLLKAAKLPPSISSLRLRAEIFTILFIAQKLSKKLRDGDNISEKITLNKTEYILCFLKGIYSSVSSVGKTNNRKSLFKSSFFIPLMTLNKEKRSAMFDFYGFCRIADDMADEAESAEQAIKDLDFLKNEVEALFSTSIYEYPKLPAIRKLLPHIKKYNLTREYFDEIINGQIMDVNNEMIKPLNDKLDRYCYRVASCVGLVSIEIFGYKNPDTKKFAIHLGKGMQIINILRDIEEDAQRERIYIPHEMLYRYGFGNITSSDLINKTEILHSDSMKDLLASFADEAREHIRLAKEALSDDDKKNMQPALLMQKLYLSYLSVMEKRKWDIMGENRIKMSLFYKLKTVFIS